MGQIVVAVLEASGGSLFQRGETTIAIE